MELRAIWTTVVCGALAAGAVAACDDAGGGGNGTVTPVDSNGPDIRGTSDTNVPQATRPGPRDTSTSSPTGDTGPGPQDTSQPTGPTDTSQPPGPTDTTQPPAGSAPVGAACTQDSDCVGGADATCITEGFSGGYCMVANCGGSSPCPEGSTCFDLGGGLPPLCIEDCQSDSECRESEGYECDSYDTCWPKSDGPAPTGDSDVGAPCDADADCSDVDSFCYPAQIEGDDTGFYKGYCMVADCSDDSCPGTSVCEEIFSDGGTACLGGCERASDCQPGYSCYAPGICWPGCGGNPCPANWACDAQEDHCVPDCTPGSCTGGLVCRDNGLCGEPPCTSGSCQSGYVCAPSGECVPDLDGGPGVGPGPTCNDIPPAECTGSAAQCSRISLFEPVNGPGYTNYPLNGEDWDDQYRSYATEDLQMLVKWAAAMVDCKAKSWGGGNGAPIGLGDMSEANGDIPGTREGRPGHPEYTHEDGRDMDIAYFQIGTANNYLRPVCPYTINGQDQSHCVGPPDKLDLWRSAYFLGLMGMVARTRVVGVDGKIGPLVDQAVAVLCGNGWLSGAPCDDPNNVPWTYEVVDEGRYWYLHHHHHMHVSTYGRQPSGAPELPGSAREACKVPGCVPVDKAESFECLTQPSFRTIWPIERPAIRVRTLP